jgi:trans-aconitate methyltransferase
MSNCLVCNCNNFIPIYDNTLLKCKECNFVTANLEVNSEQLKKVYSENYFKGEEYLDYIADKEAIQKNFSKRIKKIKISKNNTVNAIEIGCAYGFFAEVFNKEFPNSKYKGIDIVEEAINYGRTNLNQNLECIDYLNLHSQSSYSHIFMWDVIEHLPEPAKFIKKISEESSTGSLLYITTGDIERLLPRIQKSKWRMIHPPSHLHYFSKKTITQLLKNNGFKVEKVTYPAVYRSIEQIFYSLFILNKKESKFVKGIYNFIPKSLYIPINTYDIMFVIARKK